MYQERIKNLKLMNADIGEQLTRMTNQGKQLAADAQNLEGQFMSNKVRIDLLQTLDKEKKEPEKDGTKKDIPKR